MHDINIHPINNFIRDENTSLFLNLMTKKKNKDNVKTDIFTLNKSSWNMRVKNKNAINNFDLLSIKIIN